MTDRSLDFDLGAYGRDVTLRRGISATEASLDIAEGAGRTLPTVPFPVTIISAADPDDTEKAWVTARTGDTLTVTRGFESTTATERLAGDFVAVDVNWEAVFGNSTIIVAASDATADEKAAAHFVCDGVDDEEEINAAFAAGQAIPLAEGSPGYFDGKYIVQLTRGTFTLGDNIEVPDPGPSNQYYQTIVFRGSGTQQTYVDLGSDPTGDGMIDVQNVNGHVTITVEQMRLYFHDDVAGYGGNTKPLLKMQTQIGKGYVQLFDLLLEHY